MNDDEHQPVEPPSPTPLSVHEAGEHSQDLTIDGPLATDLGAALRAALTPRSDVRDNARHRVDRALRSRSAASALTSMCNCGLDTVRHLLTNPAPSADRYSMMKSRLIANTLVRSEDEQDQEADND